MTTFKLQSADFVSAPGLVAWAINGYFFESDREVLLDVVQKTWNIPRGAARSLISGAAPHKIVRNLTGDTIADEFVEFEWSE